MLAEIKKLGVHSFTYWIGVMLAKIVGFLLIPLYTRYLTPADYGIIELLHLTADVAALLIGMQISQGVFRFYQAYESQTEKDLVVSTALISMLVLGIAMAAILNILARPITLLVFGSDAYLGYFRFFSSIYPLTLIIEVPFALIRIKGRSKLFILCNFLNFLFTISLSIVFVVYMGWGVWGVIISPAITFTSLAIFLIKRTFSEVGVSFSFKMVKQIFRFTIPLVPAGIGMFVLHFSDRYFVKHFCSLSDVGIYSLGYKFGFIVSVMVIAPFNLIWQTYMYELAKEKNASEIYGRVLTYFTFVLVFTGLAISIPSREIIRIITIPAFFRASGVIPMIVSAYVLSGVNIIFQAGLLVKGKSHYIGIITFSTAVLNLMGNYFFVSTLGIIGAAISTIISFLFMATCMGLVSLRVYPFRIEYLRIIKIVLIAAIIYILSRFMRSEDLYLSLLFKAILILAFPFGLLGLKVLDVGERETILKFKEYMVKKFV
jgi:O-antigen/teichoic acid export membrane protein